MLILNIDGNGCNLNDLHSPFKTVGPFVYLLFSHVSSVPKKMSKKRKLADGSRKLVQPIPLDSSGRPVFPIVLGGLTVYSLGEVSVLSPWSLISLVKSLSDGSINKYEIYNTK